VLDVTERLGLEKAVATGAVNSVQTFTFTPPITAQEI